MIIQVANVALNSLNLEASSAYSRWSQDEIDVVSWIRSDAILAWSHAKIHFLRDGWPFAN